MTRSHENPPKMIQRVSQDSDDPEPVPEIFQPRERKRFRLKYPTLELRDVTATGLKKPVSRLSEVRDLDYSLRDQIQRDNDVLPDRGFKGDWLQSRMGSFIKYMVVLIGLYALVWGGILLWSRDPLTFFFWLLVIMLVYGVIDSGMKFGESSIFKQDYHGRYF